MAEKFGATLTSAEYAVTIIGYGSSGPSSGEVIIHPLGEFPRLSLQRYLARWRTFQFAFVSRPDVFIFSTHELIFPAVLLKVFLGTRIIYDLRENYFRNIRYSEGLPVLLRLPLAIVVRAIEKITAPAIDHFFLAEQAYDKEFRFHRGGWTVLENKALPLPRPDRPRGLKLLFSGTLSESTGVFRAIRLAKKLHEASGEASLTIAGYAASPAAQRRIREEAAGISFVRLVGVDSLVPHNKIRSLIAEADAGIIAYPRLPHTENSVPTKLFEYLQAQLPILTEDHWPWIPRFAGCAPFVTVNLENPEPTTILNALKNNVFYTQPIADAGWSSEAPKLLAAVKNTV